MDVRVTTEAVEFDAAAGTWLRADPVGHTIFVAALNTLLGGGSYSADPPLFAWVEQAGAVCGALMRTPPFPLALARMPEAAVMALARELPGAGIDVAGFAELVGPPEVLAGFAAAAGLDLTITLRETQYRLDRLVPPPVVPGVLRALGEADHELYLTWVRWFEEDAGIARGGDAQGHLDNRLRGGGRMWLWDVGGEAVCLVGVTAPVGGVVRIGPVFTPRAHRRRGYAAAATAAACAEALARGVHACTLFADAANETSNGVYRRLGFVPVGELVEASAVPC